MLFIQIIWILIVASGLTAMLLLLKFGLSKSLAFLNTNSDAIKIALSSVAVVYAAALYHVEFVGQQVGRTLEFSKKSEVEPLSGSLRTLDDLWIRGPGCEVLKSYRKDEIDNSDWAAAANTFIRRDGHERHVMDVHSYYVDLVTCVSRNRCDQRSACEIFAKDIENFRLTYRDFFVDWEDAYQSPIIKPLKSFYFQCQSNQYLLELERKSNSLPASTYDYSCGP